MLILKIVQVLKNGEQDRKSKSKLLLFFMQGSHQSLQISKWE